METQRINQADLSRLVGITRQRIATLTDNGTFDRDVSGTYDLVASVQAYITLLQLNRKSRHDSPTFDDENEIEVQKLRKLTEEADRLAIANAQSRGELVEIETVKRLGEKVMVAIRQKILSMPLTDTEKDLMLADLFALRELDWTAA